MKIRLGYVAISNALGKKVTSSSNVTYKTYSKITSEENAYKTHITCNKMQHRPKISNKYA